VENGEDERQRGMRADADEKLVCLRDKCTDQNGEEGRSQAPSFFQHILPGFSEYSGGTFN
jgi:hypothetical protein